MSHGGRSLMHIVVKGKFHGPGGTVFCSLQPLLQKLCYSWNWSWSRQFCESVKPTWAKNRWLKSVALLTKGRDINMWGSMMVCLWGIFPQGNSAPYSNHCTWVNDGGSIIKSYVFVIVFKARQELILCSIKEFLYNWQNSKNKMIIKCYWLGWRNFSRHVHI